MSDIAPISRTAAAALEPRTSVQRASEQVQVPESRKTDSVELSNAARYLAKIAELPDIREELVGRVKAEIEAGSYDTDDKIDASLEALAEDLG
ncbi:flagellar biosynthesis anti-sigma factor FlgM [Poriferisphaera sp. WC338]|uniref:flagellar biosynthesis anti-sigma factor FlgM n=1 Tax=Poriferisphaera sp. WC338 TaxID=3425129 RepID=UPI003D81821D